MVFRPPLSWVNRPSFGPPPPPVVTPELLFLYKADDGSLDAGVTLFQYIGVDGVADRLFEYLATDADTLPSGILFMYMAL